jgi:hypothetical protein
MEELIKQAFLHVDVIGPHVQEGHYDLIGPNGDIILPSVWEKVVEPDWAITMHMWPMDKAPLRHPQMPPGMPLNGMPRPGHPHPHAVPRPHPGGPPAEYIRPISVRPPGGRGGPIPPPPPAMGGGMWPPMGPGMPRPGPRPGPGAGPQIVSVEPAPQPVRTTRIKKPDPRASGLMGWVVGGVGGKPKASSKKYVRSMPTPTPSQYHHSFPYLPEENHPKHKHTPISGHRPSSFYMSYFFAPAQMMWLPKSVAFR